MIEGDLQEVLKKHLAALSEHFDTVQIFVCNYDDGGAETTRTLQKGQGNWYTRYGQINEWVIQQDARARNEILERDDN